MVTREDLTRAELVAAIAIIPGLLAPWLPAVPATRRMQRHDNPKQRGLALHDHEGARDVLAAVGSQGFGRDQPGVELRDRRDRRQRL